MPVRLLREGILTSERVNKLDASAEVFYRRLMSRVDDHGLFDARPAVLRAALYPLKVDQIREADISRWMAACQKAGLLALYVNEGKTYLQMLDTRWQARSAPKYPPPPGNQKSVDNRERLKSIETNFDQLKTAESNCSQLKTTAHLDVVVDEDVDEDVNPPIVPPAGGIVGLPGLPEPRAGPENPVAPTRKQKNKKQEWFCEVEKPDEVSQQTWDDYCRHRRDKGVNITKTSMNLARREADKADITLEKALAITVGMGWKGFLATYYESRRGSNSSDGKLPMGWV